MNHNQKHKRRIAKPPWLKRRLPTGPTYEEVRTLLSKSRLHTVCQEARCPNLWECFSRQTATFLILGPCCTRNCRFCNVTHGRPSGPPDSGEPSRVAQAVKNLGLSYVVITSVTRDDLPDGGAGLFAKTIKKIRAKMPGTLVEVLIPDFQGNEDALRTVLEARPHALNHNLETVSRLYPLVRPKADYRRSLELLSRVKQSDSFIPTKSGLMLGLGESAEEVENTLQDLLDVKCSILTLGQYLQPTSEHLNVERFISPEEFDDWKKAALKMGFSQVASGPLVRSSYRAKDLYRSLKNT
ncbi:MAG: lipoyl synthase, partial [Deltaproteobacteria bacterium]|nr:lipoyl synthase [Deltaproteobacteria bacterium]MBW2319393.1 lipoyl synthase [Deltaproteobacteria bacterium]